MTIRIDDVLIDDEATNIRMSGVSANLRMGGSGTDGDLLLYRTDGDITDDSTATIHLDGQQANLRMAGSGADGDILLFPSGGDRTDDSTATIHLDANSGGKVYCKVDASFGAIEIGDLLSTSTTPGHAMKATDASKAFGTVIGKALKPWAEDAGLIPVLVARH